MKLVSTIPDVDKCVVSGEGVKQVVKGEMGWFQMRFLDKYSNPTIQTPDFRSSFQAGMCLIAQGAGKDGIKQNKHDFEGEWIDEDFEVGYSQYRMSYVPTTAGAFWLHVWWEDDGQRIAVPTSPFSISIHTNASDQIISHEVVDASGITPGDYKIQRAVFDEAQRRWGDCTVDGFASAATSLLPRFWTKTSVMGAEAANALKQDWKTGERIWAHPPPSILPQIVKKLASPDRAAEVIVCTPFRPSMDWFFHLSSMSDEQQKYMAGKLTRVAKDAPDRLEEWPIMLFHVPAKVMQITGPAQASQSMKPRALEQDQDPLWPLENTEHGQAAEGILQAAAEGIMQAIPADGS